MSTTTNRAERAARLAEVRTYAGVKVTGYVRGIGSLVTVYDAEAQGFDPDGGRWSVVCEDHGCIVNTDRLVDAISARLGVDEWCEFCRDEVAR